MPGFWVFGRSKCWIVFSEVLVVLEAVRKYFPPSAGVLIGWFYPIGLTRRCSGSRGLKILTSTYVDAEIFKVDINDKM
ncbi:hypothetical protein Taro_036597 [Colocasia esculenta]|uniref:Uncharacterized protein n=1 Tax=Colocasia esculenta TaxID=4460 RepID=A0A843W3H1_COLES|nr:hypothetical protein [Colocasia esculenta]